MNSEAKFIQTTLLILSIVLLCACSEVEKPVKGFILPPGDAVVGKAAFVEIGCPKCHTVAGTDITQPPSEQFHIELGKDDRRVRHYGDLLTSVVNPDHKVSPAYRVQNESKDEFSSPMPKFANEMTVAEMINIVEFLHGAYEKNLDKYLGHYYYYGP